MLTKKDKRDLWFWTTILVVGVAALTYIELTWG